VGERHGEKKKEKACAIIDRSSPENFVSARLIRRFGTSIGEVSTPSGAGFRFVDRKAKMVFEPRQTLEFSWELETDEIMGLSSRRFPTCYISPAKDYDILLGSDFLTELTMRISFMNRKPQIRDALAAMVRDTEVGDHGRAMRFEGRRKGRGHRNLWEKCEKEETARMELALAEFRVLGSESLCRAAEVVVPWGQRKPR
jgi:hypothetical protein